MKRALGVMTDEGCKKGSIVTDETTMVSETVYWCHDF